MMEFRIDDGSTGPIGRFRDDRTTWHGRKMRLAAVFMNGMRFPLSLAETFQCAQGAEKCLELLSLFAEEAEATDRRGMDGCAVALRDHCRTLTGWKAEIKRDVPRRRPQRYTLG